MKNDETTNREWAGRAYKLSIEVRELKLALEMARSEAEYMSPGFETRVQTGQTNRTEDRAINVCQLSAELSTLVAKKQRIILEVQRAIEKTVDTEIRSVLYARYINCKTIDTIAQEHGYSVRHITRMLRQGENELQR